MKNIRMAFVIMAMVCAAATLHAQIDLPHYIDWQSWGLSNPGEPHYYVSGTILSAGPTTAEIRVGIGGMFPQYEVTTQACRIMPDGSVNPVAPPTSVNNMQVGNYSEIVLSTPMVPLANALRTWMTPIGYPGPGVGGTVEMIVELTDVNAIAYLGAATASITCPSDCQKVSGKCSGKCGTLGPKCCKGLRSVLRCDSCRIDCPDGDC